MCICSLNELKTIDQTSRFRANEFLDEFPGYRFGIMDNKTVRHRKKDYEIWVTKGLNC